MRNKTLFISFILLMILAGCAARSRISDIRNTPRRFHDKVVTIGGVVENTVSIPLINVGVYQINDGSGKIWVKPKNTTPFKGDRITVTGKIKVGLTISGKNFGIILIESEEDKYY